MISSPRRTCLGMPIALAPCGKAQPIGARLASAAGLPNTLATMNSPDELPRKKRHDAHRKTSIQSLFRGECA